MVQRFADRFGYAPALMHALLKQELVPVHHRLENGRGELVRDICTPGSTARLTTVEFHDLITRAQRLGAACGIEIPDPGAR